MFLERGLLVVVEGAVSALDSMALPALAGLSLSASPSAYGTSPKFDKSWLI